MKQNLHTESKEAEIVPQTDMPVEGRAIATPCPRLTTTTLKLSNLTPSLSPEGTRLDIDRLPLLHLARHSFPDQDT
jgi:hypothetical protein